MSVARAWAVTVTGVEGRMVEVEADLAQGLPKTVIVGLPDAALSEAATRVRAAVTNSGLRWPDGRVTVGLSPASLPKRGSAFDLAVATAVLGAAGAVPSSELDRSVLVAELGLDGRVRPVVGVLPCALAAAAAGLRRVVVAAENAAEAALVHDLEVWPVETLREVVEVMRGEVDPASPPGPPPARPEQVPDLADVVGQGEGRRAVEVCAAGGHHLLLHGPPGAGKTMLAERLPGLLPPLTEQQALEVAVVRSLAAGGGAPPALSDRPPFVAPHHTASPASVLGGGSRFARPGAVSLAHHGVLFVDEAPEMDRRALEGLREPLESGVVTVARTDFQVTLPARVQLVLAANPCPCGAAQAGGGGCRCSPHARRRYAARLSGPLLDRVDVVVRVDRVGPHELFAARLPGGGGEPTAAVAARVADARARAARRWAEQGWACNAQATGAAVRALLPDDDAVRGLLQEAVRRGALSARGVDKVLRVALTCADLRGAAAPTVDDVHQAVALRLHGTWGAAAESWQVATG